MTEPPRLTDTCALRRNRHRALAAGPALFLHEAAADEVQERLSLVNRQFTAPALIAPFSKPWSALLPDAVTVADTDTLNIAVGAHDLVIHALALHWSNDPVGQLVQARRALRPDGMFLGVLFGGRTLWQLRQALAEAEAALAGGLSPRVAPMAEIRDLGALLQRSGFAMPVADSLPFQVTYASAWDLMRDLRAMGEGNALAARFRKPVSRSLFAETARRYAHAHAGSDGRVPADFELIFLTGWAPDESQPRPLRPGSATARLADALGAKETVLPPRQGADDD